MKVILSLVLAAVGLRAAYFVQLNEGPCIWQHRWTQSDLNHFHEWAMAIADGNGLSRPPLSHPFHQWHFESAEIYFERHAGPQEAQAFRQADGAEKRRLARDLWERWYGGSRFHQEPLYPYLISLFYAVLGPDPRWLLLLQMAAGIGTILCVHELARRHFGALTGAVAGLLALLCGPLLFCELILLRTSLLAFAGVGLPLLAELALERRSGLPWFLFGLASGAALILQASLMLLSASLVVILAAPLRRELPLLAKRMAAAALGTGVFLAPVVARNIAVGAPPAGVTSIAAVTYINSNVVEYRGHLGWKQHDDSVARIMSLTRGAFWPTVRETLKTHTALSFLGLGWQKVSVALHGFESPNNESFYFYRQHAPVLWLAPVTGHLLIPLGLLGIVLSASRRGRDHRVIYSQLGALFLPLVLFYVVGRLRLPWLVALIPLTSIALVRLAEWGTAGTWRPFSLATACVVALGAWCARPLPPELHPVRLGDHAATFQTWYQGRIDEAVRVGDWGRAADIYGEFFAFEPAEMREIAPGGAGPRSPSDAAGAGWYAGIYQSMAKALLATGREDEALQSYERARYLGAVAERASRDRERP